MNIIKIVKKYLGSKLEEIGFSIRRSDKNTVEYTNDKGMILLDKGSWKKGCLHIEIFRNRKSDNDETRLFLSYIANGFDNLNRYNTGDWYFDTEEELIGLLEHIYEVLKKYGFTWMNRKEPFNVHKKIEEDAAERETVGNNMTQEEKDIRLNQVKIKFKEWKAQRFLPNKWKGE